MNALSSYAVSNKKAVKYPLAATTLQHPPR